jgi:EmrB/QacA subfamily drug resistance transporter
LSGPVAPPCEQLGRSRRTDAEGHVHGLRGALVVATTILGSSIAFIDTSVVSVALPAIQADLDASLADMTWVVNAFVLFLASLILVGGSLGDHLGRRRVFIGGVVLFAVGSAACALAPTVEALIAARALKGVGGALLVPNSLAILSAAFPKETRGRAIGAWSGFAALTSAGGPAFGGWLVDAFGWPSVFLINLPIAAATVLMALAFVPESRGGDAEGGLDWTGAALAAAGLGGFTFGLVGLSEGGGGALNWAALVLGTALFAGFIVWEGRTPHPMAPLRLFRSRTFSGVNLLTFFLYAALAGALFFVPFVLIQLQGYSAAEAGAAFLPFSLPLGLLSAFVGQQMRRFGARLPLIVGSLIVAAAFVLMSLLVEPRPYMAGWFWAFLLLGVGMTLVVAPLTTAVFNSVEDAWSGAASGVNNAVARTAQLVAVAALGAVAVVAFTPALESRLADSSLAPAARTAMLEQTGALAETEPPAGLAPAQAMQAQAAVAGAFGDAFRAVTLLCAGLALIACAVAVFMVRDDEAAARGSAP